MITVSIHDVSPAFEREIDDALEACAAAVKRLLSRDVRGAALAASASILSSKEHVEKLVERYEALLHAKSRS